DGIRDFHVTGVQTCALPISPAKLKDWSAKYGVPEQNCYNYENFDQIKDNPDIDAVYVITPNSLHHDQVIRVARAGKHAICEKPRSEERRVGKEERTSSRSRH